MRPGLEVDGRLLCDHLGRHVRSQCCHHVCHDDFVVLQLNSGGDEGRVGDGLRERQPQLQRIPHRPAQQHPLPRHTLIHTLIHTLLFQILQVATTRQWRPQRRAALLLQHRLTSAHPPSHQTSHLTHRLHQRRHHMQRCKHQRAVQTRLTRTHHRRHDSFLQTSHTDTQHTTHNSTSMHATKHHLNQTNCITQDPQHQPKDNAPTRPAPSRSNQLKTQHSPSK